MLRNVAYGPHLEPTFATLAAKKLAELVLFAAFLDLAIVLGLGGGAVIGALVLVAQPVVAANSGALAPVAAGAAFVLAGRAIASRIAPTVGDLVGGGLAVLAAIFVTPWLLALLPTVWLPREGGPPQPRITPVIALVVPFAAAIAVAFTRGDPIVFADAVGSARTLAELSLSTIPPASAAIAGLAILFALRGAPAFAIGVLASPLAAATIFRPDLGAVFVVAILFALTVTVAVDRVAEDRPWAANLAAVTVFFFVLAPISPAVDELLRARVEAPAPSETAP